jgi:hypothetical protein
MRSSPISSFALLSALHFVPWTLSRSRNCESMISIAAVEEITYRQSRLCRLLGNPVAFAVVALLTNGKDLSTGNGLCGSVLANFDLNARTRGFFCGL